VTCAHCAARLGIKRTPSTASTGVPGEIAGHTAQRRDDLEILRLKSELELLDVSWANKRAECEKAASTAPTGTGRAHFAGAGFGCLLAVVGFFAILGAMAGAPDAGGPGAAVIGLLLMIAGTAVTVACAGDPDTGNKSQAAATEVREREAAARAVPLRRAQESYESRRAEILRRLDAQAGPGHRGTSVEVVRAG